MKDKTKSAIDSIYNIESRLEDFDKRFSSIESQIKILNSKLEKALKAKDVEQNISSGGLPSARPPIANARQDKKVEKLVLGSTKTFGYIVNKNKEPIKGVEVNVYDSDNDVIKKYLQMMMDIGRQDCLLENSELNIYIRNLSR